MNINRGPLLIFAGQSNRPLAEEICKHLGIPLGKSETIKFTNDNLIVQYTESLREGDVFIVQSFSTPVSVKIRPKVRTKLPMATELFSSPPPTTRATVSITTRVAWCVRISVRIWIGVARRCEWPRLSDYPG